jgi:hypothetical protein
MGANNDILKEWKNAYNKFISEIEKTLEKSLKKLAYNNRISYAEAFKKVNTTKSKTIFHDCSSYKIKYTFEDVILLEYIFNFDISDFPNNVAINYQINSIY